MTWKRLPVEVRWGIVIFVLLNIPFFISRLDIQLISYFYHPQHPYPWDLRSKYPWNLFYYFGSYPGILLALIALIFVILSYINRNFIRFRKESLFVLVALIVGPGLVVNAILKDHYGRPRPREIRCFGGQQEYYSVLKPAFQARGKSFPCGHCSMGFYFFTLFYVWKKRRKWLSRASLLFALLYGTLIGVARMGQGGHFPSDVLWAGGFVFFITAFLYYKVFKLHKWEGSSVKENVKLLPKSIMIPVGVVTGILLLLGVLVATPIYLDSTVSLKSTTTQLILRGQQGDIVITSTKGDSSFVQFHTEGFGFPGNKLLINSKLQQGKTQEISYLIKGIHTEAKTTILCNNRRIPILNLDIQDSHVLVDSTSPMIRYTISLKRGSITINGISTIPDTVYFHIRAPYKKIVFRKIRKDQRIVIQKGKVQTYINHQWINHFQRIQNNPIIIRAEKSLDLLLINQAESKHKEF